MSNERSDELEAEIWGHIEQWLSGHGPREPVCDTTFWTSADWRAYESAFRRVKLTVERKAGGDPTLEALGWTPRRGRPEQARP